MKKKIPVLFGLAFLFGLALHLTAGGQQSGQQSTQTTAPKVTVGAPLKAKAQNPAPGPTAKQGINKTSIGAGPTAVAVSQPSSFWTEALDVDDDGDLETSDFLYDAQRGVLYTYREDDFACQDGQPANGSILEALYSDGNRAGHPAGSGWYVVSLDTGKCGARRSGTYGCRFDTNGNPTGCGAVAINNATGDITVATGASPPEQSRRDVTVRR